MAPRNLVVIVADTLRDPKGLQRGGPSLMPFLDAFAKSGARFERLLASSSWTAPSHVSLLTGLDPWETHFEVPGASRRPPPAESVADAWGKAGGVSAAFSANFVVTPVLGTATGYTRFNPGFPSGTAGKLQLALQFSGYERLLYWAVEAGYRPTGGPLGRLGSAALSWGGTGFCRSIGGLRNGDTMARSLASFLRRRRRTGATKPLHLFFNLVEAHEPYLPGDNGGPAGGPRDLAHLPSINLARLTDALSPYGSPERFQEVYRASLPVLDRALERIVRVLQRSGVLDNAVLLFLSDHGQSLGEQGFYGHGYYLFDELVKVPAYLWEFKDGKPLPAPSLPTEWVDHRHLFDLLRSVAPDGAPVAPQEILTDSLVRRGPACSYFEGPRPRPPGGFVFKTPRSQVYRMLRVQAGEAAVMGMSDGEGKNLRSVPTHSLDPTSPELEAIAHQILGSIQGVTAATSGPQSALDAQVDARLKSWGYD